MTARCRITASDIARAAALAKTEGVTVTITTANGKSFTIAPVDPSANPAQASAAQIRAEEEACDKAFGVSR
jgi:hypothetical protein